MYTHTRTYIWQATLTPLSSSAPWSSTTCHAPRKCTALFPTLCMSHGHSHDLTHGTITVSLSSSNYKNSLQKDSSQSRPRSSKFCSCALTVRASHVQVPRAHRTPRCCARSLQEAQACLNALRSLEAVRKFPPCACMCQSVLSNTAEVLYT